MTEPLHTRQSIDWWLVGAYLVLILIGWLNIYASVHTASAGSILDWSSRAGKQFVWILTALGLAGGILFLLPARFWEEVCIPFYTFVVALLVLVIFVSSNVKGSHSWFDLGPIRFQPAEISKISTSLLLAYVMSREGFKISRWKDLVLASLVIGVPMLVIIAESETGSALVYAGFIFVMYREGLSGWWLVMLGVAILLFVLTIRVGWWLALILLVILCVSYVLLYAGKSISLRHRRFIIRNAILGFAAGVTLILAADIFFNRVLKDYQRERIEVLLRMKEDLRGVGYNVHQSLIAIGSGGLLGKGYLQGTQTTFGFVPEQSTDFIFCTVGEEWGFVGSLVLIVMYGLLIFWIIQDSERARNASTRIYGYCVASCFFMHLAINIGMTLGLMPVIGIPLPLFSYGGSSLWAFTLLLFIFIALERQEKKYF